MSHLQNVNSSASLADGQSYGEDATTQSTSGDENNLSSQINGVNLNSNDDDRVSETSCLDRSYEILNDSSNKQQVASDMEPTDSQRSDTPNNLDESKADVEEEQKKTDIVEARRGSFDQASHRKSSGSFLSKLTSSTSSYDNINKSSSSGDAPTGQTSYANLPSTFANLISSVSFTSSFRGNSGGASASITNSNSVDTQGNKNSFTEQNESKLTIETASTLTDASGIAETREQILSKKPSVERKNLISLTKLIVKDLISSSLTIGRTIDDYHQCAIHLNNYFTLLDRVLKHGLKQNILSNKSASLWNALDNLPKYLNDKRLTSETVRSLAHTKTPDGRIKAWLRIAMMQKKLPEYFNELLANRNALLRDIYYNFAFMLNDEAQVFAGLIIGVNVIDCNFFVKDDNFDMMDEVIELSPYLRAANSFDEDDQQVEKLNMITQDKTGQLETLTAVLDQKNYLEERSLHLETTVESLRDKVRQLEELNSRLEMDAKLNEVRIQKLQATGPKSGENITNDKLLISGFPLPNALKSLMNPSMDSKLQQKSQNTNQDETAPSEQPFAPNEQPPTSRTDLENTRVDRPSRPVSSTPESTSDALDKQQLVADLERAQRLASERDIELVGLRERVSILEVSYRGALEKIRAFERDVEVQTSMNSQKETTIETYERDLRDRQQQLESLRSSLNDARTLNSELNERLNDTGAKLKDRLNTVTSLQASLDKWKLENKQLASRYQDRLTALKSVTTQLDQSLKTIGELKKYNEKINDDLRRERECGLSSSNIVEEQRAKIKELTQRLDRLEGELKELRPYKELMVGLKKRCQEYEQSLEEVGYQLRASREEVESLKENSSVFLDSQWMDSKQVKECALCQQTFSVTRRKHHCRLCGNVFCQTCSDNKMELASSAKPVRVCDTCHAFLLAKFIKASSATT